ncbi:hypothetical protein [Nostoc sp.]|uniref:hypothetical protein n=1 Tax=Nostoc sp. TaxID=1180 RepID=UPI002FFA406A
MSSDIALHLINNKCDRTFPTSQMRSHISKTRRDRTPQNQNAITSLLCERLRQRDATRTLSCANTLPQLQ